MACSCVKAGLLERQKISGQGRFISTSILECKTLWSFQNIPTELGDMRGRSSIPSTDVIKAAHV